MLEPNFQPAEDPMAGVTDETITFPVTPEQAQQLAAEMPGFGPRVTHKLAIGPHYLPGLWVPVSVQVLDGKANATMARIEQ
jgi:hypothetical protein